MKSETLTLKELSSIAKYRKFNIIKLFNTLVFFTTLVSILFKLEHQLYSYELNILTISEFIFFIAALLVQYTYLFGFTTSNRYYQRRLLIKCNFKKTKLNRMIFLQAILNGILAFIASNNNIYVFGAIMLITLFIHLILIDINDLPSIKKRLNKLGIDYEQYKILNDDNFDILNAKQKLYVFIKREELNNQIIRNNDVVVIKSKLDREEYIYLRMITSQIEKLND